MKYQNHSGFTLVELLVVIVIVGILAAIAFPAYEESLKKSRRTDGQSALLNVMNAEERYFTENNTYSTSLADLNVVANSAEGYYVISAAACGSGITSCVKLTATAQGAQASDGNLTYDSLGNKTPADKW